jgi:DNA invertase Pin-like site-specific DNA recombinase
LISVIQTARRLAFMTERADLAIKGAAASVSRIVNLAMRDLRRVGSTLDLLNIIKSIADRKGSFQSLGEQWADTTTATGRLMLTILGGLAEIERKLITARTAEGRERAKGRGVRMGRKHKLTPHSEAEVRKRKADGHSVRDVSPNTISRYDNCCGTI